MRNETTTRFALLVERHQDMAFATALSALGHVQQAEDAAQEAFVEAYISFPRLRAPEAFTSWFQVILRRSITRVRTRSWYTTTPLPQEKSLDPRPQIDLRLEVAAALSTLPPTQREAIILHYMGGYTAPELAEQLGLPLTTIKKRLADARRTLRTRMEPNMEEKIMHRASHAVADPALQRSGAHGRRHHAGDDGTARQNREHCRREGCHGKPRARDATACVVRAEVCADFGRGRDRAWLQRAWRRRMYFGDGECGAAFVLRLPDCVREGRLCDGARVA